MKISDGVIQVTRPEWTVPTPGRLTMPPPKTPPAPDTTPTPGTTPIPEPAPPWGWAAPARASSLTLEGTAAGWFAPTAAAAAWSVNVNPDNPQPDRLRPTALIRATSPAADLSWLTAESVADLDPWGETGTPSTGP
ncbi:hypothetical protein G3I17_24710 [Streptomyces sp. SID13031]|nr:hypothetical protein [Streptomyces sp. SID13031]